MTYVSTNGVPIYHFMLHGKVLQEEEITVMVYQV